MISLTKVKIGAVALASVAAVTVTAAPGSAATASNPHKNCGQKQLAAIYKVRHEIDPHSWYLQLKAADVPGGSAGLAFRLRLTKAERLLRFTLYLEQAAIRRQCQGGD